MADALSLIRDEVEAALKSIDKDTVELRADMNKFLTDLEPDINRVISTGDLRGLDFLRDRISAKLARCSLDLVAAQQKHVSSVIAAVIGTVIRLGIGAI